MRGTAGRAALLGTGTSAETKNEMDNRVLFSQEPTNKVVFKHPIMLGGGTRGDETLLIDGMPSRSCICSMRDSSTIRNLGTSLSTADFPVRVLS
jgi:hypothetical protein